MLFQTHSFDVFSYHSSPRGPVKLVRKHTLTHRSHYLCDYLNTTGMQFSSLSRMMDFKARMSHASIKRTIFFKGKGDKRRMFCDEHSIFLKAQTFCPELLHTCSRV